MSSFPGRMREYPTISIDRFDKENLHARAYFLSHCHKDHMKGLKGPILKRKLKFSLTVKLYCSFVTKELLLSNPKYSFWEDHIVALELDSPTHILLTDETTGESEDVVVTLLPAGHCPGSVMFLFEGAPGTVLYTGDFRLAAGDAARLEHLHSGDRVKNIQSVYIDSTFYDPRFYQIPSRESCLAGIRKLVQDWISLSPYHVVWLNCKAAYGYEYLFTNLGEEFSLQVHVNSLFMYRKMPEILCHVTTDRTTQIHACRHPKDDELFRANRLPCGSVAPDGTPLRIISIKPSTMWFGERTRKTNVIVRKARRLGGACKTNMMPTENLLNIHCCVLTRADSDYPEHLLECQEDKSGMGGSSYRACFSFHSSYSEIKDFLSYISPVHIHPNVVPLGRSMEEVSELLKLMCRKKSENEVVYKPLGKLKRARTKCTSQGSESEDELFEEVVMEPSRKKPMNEIKEHHSLEISDRDDRETKIQPEVEPVIQTSNYMDCTESNDDDDDCDEWEEKELSNPEPATQSRSQLNTSSSGIPPPVCVSQVLSPKQDLPSWSKFFKAEPVLTDESGDLAHSQNSQSSDYRTTQSPEHFDDDESAHLTSSQSTHVSDAGLESLSQLDTEPVQASLNTDSLMSKLCTRHDFHTSEEAKQALLDNGEEHTEPLSDSQVSSDFDLPQTPGSKPPHSEELSELYKKLAAGEEVLSKNV